MRGFALDDDGSRTESGPWAARCRVSALEQAVQCTCSHEPAFEVAEADACERRAREFAQEFVVVDTDYGNVLRNAKGGSCALRHHFNGRIVACGHDGCGLRQGAQPVLQRNGVAEDLALKFARGQSLAEAVCAFAIPCLRFLRRDDAAQA